MRKKDFRRKRLLAGLMLLVMVSSVVADCNAATAFAADNKINISESEIVLEKKEYQNENPSEADTNSNQNNISNTINENNNLEENNASEEDNILDEDIVLKENSNKDNPNEAITDSNSEETLKETPDKSPKNSKENNGFEKELTVDGYKVIIKADEGVFPNGTKVEVETVDTIGDEDAQDVISEEMEEIEPDAEIVKTVTFDINFYSEEGKIIEPENGSVSITITPDLQESSELQEIEKELGTALECSVFHVDDELNVEEVECEIAEDYTEVSFEAESFSSYVVTWYAQPDGEGKQEISLEGPKYIDGFEKVPFGFSEFNIPIAWTNDDGDVALRPTKLEFTIYGTDMNAETASGNSVKICDVTVTLDDEEKIASNITINLADDTKIPVYVKRGTGEIKSGGSGYYVMDNFKYEVKFHDENIAYTAKYPSGAGNYSVVTTHREENEPIWYANAGKITNERKALAEASFKIEWYDNHNENGKRPYSTEDDTANKNAIKEKVELYYCTTDDPTLKRVTSDMMPAKEATGPKITKDSYSNWTISYKNLIPKDESGKDIIYKLKLADNFAGSDYTSDSDDYLNKDGIRKFYLLGKFEAIIRWNDGGRDNELRPEISDKIKVFTIEDGENGPVEVEKPISPEDIEISKNGNIWNFKVKNLVMYSNEGDGVVSYYVKLGNITDYGISYTNAPKSTDVLKCHNGGKIYLTLENNLDGFTIYKKWVDGEDGNVATTGRADFIGKEITLYLWRYPVKKVVGENVVMGTIEDGAPVNDANGKQYSLTLNSTDHAKNFQLHLTDFVTDGSLDMYDTQGYEYVYYVTEIMKGNEYVTSYSNINPYTHINTAVADGGTLTNLRKESIKIEGIVRWKVPSVTDYTKAAATICLQRQDTKTGEWINVGDPVIVTGFTEADPQKKHVFPAVDKYDEEGHKISYRVIETKINYNGNDNIDVEEYKPVEEAGKENHYISKDYIMNEFDYTATAHPTFADPDKYSFTVDNHMSGDVTLDITKVWATKDAYKGGDEELGNYSNISINIYQKNYSGLEELYGTVAVTGVNQKTGVIAGNRATFTNNSTSEIEYVPITVESDDANPNLVWSFEGIELPEFDEVNGRAYTYSIKETGTTSNTHTDYEYKFDGKDIRATVTNTYVPSGGGSSFYFEIDKEWNDGADLSQRQPVTVAIVRVDDEGNIYDKDNEGKTHEYVLSAENNWHKDVWISKTYGEGLDRFDKDSSDKYLWTVIEKDVSLKAEYEKFEGWDLTAADDEMDEIHREVKGYTFNSTKTEINGKVDAIAHNDINKPGYEVTIKEVGGDSVIGASKYVVTNRRAGKVNVTFDKTWHDSDNAANTRGALKVYLYQDDKLVVNDPAAATAEPSKYAYIGGIANPATGTKIGEGNSKFEYKFENLPKYDEHGVEYEYSVREFMVCKDENDADVEIEILTYDTEDTTLSGYVADIEGHGEIVTFSTDESEPEKLIRNELYKYNNTLTGKLTTGVPFYVLWHDQSSYETGGRPDMYFTLYYRPIGALDGELKKFEGDYKVLWEAITEGESGPSNPYYKKATFIGLPAADENGNAYEFFAAASLNNAAEHYYVNYFNTHEDTILLDGSEADRATVFAKSDESIHHYDIKSGASDNKVKTISVNGADVKLIPANGLVEYIIHEEIKPAGKKFWKNVPQGITETDLPDVDIYLGRYSDHDITNQMYSTESPEVTFSKKIAVTPLDEDKLSFDFATNVDPAPLEGTEASYAKYDAYGQIYTYQLAEKIYVKSENAKGYEVPNYIMKYDPDSLNLVNTYLNGETTHVGSRKITVNKTWAIPSDILSKITTLQYPEARFKLYRMEIDPKDCSSLGAGSNDIPYNPTSSSGIHDRVVAKFKTYKENGTFKECGEELKIKYSATSQSAFWEDMPIYAPSGRPYLYVVEEISDHGMFAYNITNNAPTSGNRQISNTQVLISNDGLDPKSNYEASANQKSEDFTNTLKNSDKFSKITGEKSWNEGSFTGEVRPNISDCDTGASNQQIKLVVKRTAKTQTGVVNSNAITETLKEGTDRDYTVTWSVKDGSTWVYEITPVNTTSEFQVYAPNGQPYTYTVTEELCDVAAENYKATVPSASKTTIKSNGTSNLEADGSLKENTTLSNTLKGQVQLFKKWDDALNELKLRSGHVKVILQYREVPKTNSEGVNIYSEGENTSIKWTTYNKDLTDKGVYKLSYLDGKWKKNIPNLPIKSSDGTKIYEYRVLEVEFDDHQAEAEPVNPIIYNPSADTVEYKPNKNVDATAPVPYGGPSYKNSTRFEGTGHFETQADNYIINHSVIANLTKENTRQLLVENFLSEKASLVIEKKWDGIEGADKYNVIPGNIVFKVQYSTDPDNANSWIDLIGEGGSVVTATVSKENDWKQSVDSQLPLSTGGKPTYYRAVELATNLGRFEGYTAEGRVMSEKTANPGVEYEYYKKYDLEKNKIECSTTATNTLATRTLTVKKKWNDDESAVHSNVAIELWSSNYKTGTDGSEPFTKVPGTEATLEKSKGYEFTYHNLPLKNNNGIPVVYYIKEVSVDGAAYNATKYDTAFFVSKDGSSYSKVAANSNASNIAAIDKSGTAKLVCIVNTPKTTLYVKKKWNDENNRHQFRKNVVFKLTYNNGKPWSSITGDGTDNKQYSFTKLPIYNAPDAGFVTSSNYNMGKVEYTVTEDNANVRHYGYKDPVYTVNNGTKAAAGTLTLVPSASSNNVQILNELNPPKATITADKWWDDENNRHGSRTTQVELSLYYRVGTTGEWTLITQKPLDGDGNYSDGGVYTTSEVTQALSRAEVSDTDFNKWVHDGHSSTFTTWENLPTVVNNNTIYYKVLETRGDARSSVPAGYTGDFSGYEVKYSAPNGTTFTNNGESKNQIVTNKLKRTEILVEKDWEDTAEQKIRPYSVIFELEYKHANMPWRLYREENGDVKKVVVTGDHDSKTWTGTVTDLPFADCEGHEYEYRFKEVSIEISGKEIVTDLEDDDSSFSNTTWKGELGTYKDEVRISKSSGTSYNYKVTATNTPEVGSITVTKIWDDDNNRDGLRPNTIDVTLYRDGKVYDNKAIGLNEDGTPLNGTSVSTNNNEWTYTWTNLPMYKDNAGVHDKERMSSHYVVEEPISEDIVLNYKQATYGNFRDSITNPIASHVQSRVSGKDDIEPDLWIKNTHEPIRFKLEAYKKWDDKHNKHNERPDSVNLKLQYRIYGSTSDEDWQDVIDNVPVNSLDTTGKLVQTTSAKSQEVSKSADEEYPDIWKKSAVWENLPAYVIDNNKSKLIEYRVKEVWDAATGDHYDAELPHFHYDIEEAKATKPGETYPKNHLIVENVSDYYSALTVTKEWDKKELLEKYGALPIELHVKLQEWNDTDNRWEDCTADDIEPAVILKEDEDEEGENSWTHTWQGLTKEHKYRVIEEKIVFKKGDENGVGEISISPVINTAVQGNWFDSTKVNWREGTIGNFNIDVSREEVDHTVTDPVTGDVVNSTHWKVTLKNSIPNRSIEVTKNWNDENDRDELRPTHIYVTLHRDGKKLETVILEEANNWHHEWDYLPLYKDGSIDDESAYSVIETDIHGNPVPLNGYAASYAIKKPAPADKIPLTGDFDLHGVEDGQKVEITITNTHNPAKTKVHAGKKWDDYSNKYGERVNEVYLALFYKYQHENDTQWRLVGQQSFDSELGQYSDSLIHTTSDSIQRVTGDAVNESWIKKDGEYVATWKDLPSQAVVSNVIRIPEYRVVEVRNNLIAVETPLSTALGSDITSVIRGYKTTQPAAFFVHGGDNNISFVNGGNDNEDKTIIVVNKLETVNALIIKEWDDQNNRFANRPSKIDFAIQKKKKDIAASGWNPLEQNGEPIIVSVSPEMLGDNENTWKLSVDGLPKCDVDGDELSYRAVEISLDYGGEPVFVYDDSNWFADPLPTIGIGPGHGYETNETGPISLVTPGKIEYQTTITNKQDRSVKVSAKKDWIDYDNARNTRPLSVVFEIEKKPVPSNKVEEIIDDIIEFFNENGRWEPVYELNGAGEKVVATIVLDGPDFEEVFVKKLPLHDENGKELVYRAREIELIYENRTVEVASGANPYLAPTYVDKAVVPVPITPDAEGITHSYTTEATNRIKPDPPQPLEDDPKPDDKEKPDENPGTPPVWPPVIPPEDPEKPELPPELEDIDEKIDEIEEPEDIVPIVDELIDLPDSPERDYVVKKLWVVVSIMANDPTFYDHFDPEMQDILRRFVKSGVLGRRRGLPKTSGLQGSFILLLLGFALIIIGIRLNKRSDYKE